MNIKIFPEFDLIYKGGSSIHKEINVYRDRKRGILKLMFGDKTASSMYETDGFPTSKVYHYFFLARALAKKNFKDILFIGGGALCLPSYVAKLFPNYRITSVEIDHKLSIIAQIYFHSPNPGSKFHLVHKEGLKFLESTRKKYDLIFLDIGWHKDYALIPNRNQDGLIKRTFTVAKSRIRPSGIFIANFISSFDSKGLTWFQKYYELLATKYKNCLLFADFPKERDLIQDLTVINYNFKCDIRDLNPSWYLDSGVAQARIKLLKILPSHLIKI